MRIGITFLLALLPVAAPAQPKESDTGRAINIVGRKAGATTWVIAIGADKYRVVKPLKFGGADAVAIAKAFREVGKLERSNILLINDDSDDKPDSVTLLKLIPQWLKKAGPNDTVIFSFSGHGYRDAAGNLFLAPVDFDPAKAEATGLAAKVLRQQLKDCKAAAKIILLDACHSGAFGGEQQVDAGNLAETFGKLEGAVSIVSSSGKLPSHELQTLKQGIFTHWVVRGLRGEANSKVDDVIDADELYRFLDEKVPATAKRELDVEQRPFRSFEQLAGIPVVMDLKNPDRPSVLVPAMPIPFLGAQPDDESMATVVDTMSRFPLANPRRAMGAMKWILLKTQPGSEVARLAEAHLRAIDDLIIKGEIPRSALDPARDRDDE